jgi:CheY-like chemotaxis protein
VLVADEDREFRDLVCRTLTELGCQVSTAEDGESALRLASQHRPYLVVLNVYLRKLLGVAVCEGIKGNPGLRSIRVALVGSVFKSERFVRGPRNLYGADDYFEDVISKPDMRERFRLLLSGTGPVSTSARATTNGGGAVSSAGREHVGHGGGRSVPGQPPPASHGGHDIEPRAEIRRLARIMLSDLKIYYPERFGRAVTERRLFETFREELIKGKELIVNRFPELADRLEILAGALREGLEEERSAGRARSRGTGT